MVNKRIVVLALLFVKQSHKMTSSQSSCLHITSHHITLVHVIQALVRYYQITTIQTVCLVPKLAGYNKLPTRITLPSKIFPSNLTFMQVFLTVPDNPALRSLLVFKDLTRNLKRLSMQETCDTAYKTSYQDSYQDSCQNSYNINKQVAVHFFVDFLNNVFQFCMLNFQLIFVSLSFFDNKMVTKDVCIKHSNLVLSFKCDACIVHETDDFKPRSSVTVVPSYGFEHRRSNHHFTRPKRTAIIQLLS